MNDKFKVIEDEEQEIVLHNIQFGIYDFTYDEYYEYLQLNNIIIYEY